MSDKVKTMAREIKKLSSSADNWAVIGTINDLIDDVMALNRVITSDIVRIATDDIIDALSGSEEPIEMVSKARYAEKLGIHDTHRTVTLRIPKGMTVGEALSLAYRKSGNDYVTASKWLYLSSDTDLQKALDEVEGEKK